MNVVSFPEFNITFTFSKIAFSIFGIDIYKYSICIVFGMVLALIFCRIINKIMEINMILFYKVL